MDKLTRNLISVLGLYVLLIIGLSIGLSDDPELSRKLGLGILAAGQLVSVLGLVIGIFKLRSLIKYDKIDISGKNFVDLLILLMLTILFEKTNIIIGGISRVDGNSITLPYLMALTGVGVSGVLLVVLILSSTSNKKAKKQSVSINSSILPVIFIALTLSGVGIAAWLLVIICIILLIILISWLVVNNVNIRSD